MKQLSTGMIAILNTPMPKEVADYLTDVRVREEALKPPPERMIEWDDSEGVHHVFLIDRVIRF